MRKKTLIGLLCIVTALATTFLIAPLVSPAGNSPGEGVPVLRMKQTVESGTLLTAELVETAKVAKSTSPKAALTDLSQIGTAYTSLAVGASTTLTYTFTAPPSLSNTAMSLTATADATGVITELNESNNTKTSSITINALQPDLTVISANTTDWYVGMEVLVSAEVSNLSPQPVPSVVVRLTAGSTTVNETIAVPGDGSNLAVFRFRVPGSPGTVNVTIKVDPDNLIGEVNESNNQLSQSQATVAIPASTFADPNEPSLESYFQQNAKSVPPLPAGEPSNTHAWQEIRLEGGSYNRKNYWAQLTTMGSLDGKQTQSAITGAVAHYCCSSPE